VSPSILISGASDGIGLQLAHFYARQGARLFLLGRRPPSELDASLFTPPCYCRVDLAEGGAARVVTRFLQAQGVEGLDLVFHNAALGSYGPIAEDPPAQIRALLAVNLGAPIALTHALAKTLARAHGKVVFVSSVVASLPSPDYAVYAATKAALDGFARSLRIEWRGRIDVQSIHLGAVRTGFHAKARVPAELLRSARIPTAEQAARAIGRRVRGRRAMPSVGLANGLVGWMGRHGERPLDWLMRRRRS